MPNGPTPNDPFTPVVEEDKLDPRFRQVAEHPVHAPTRAMVRRIFSGFVDADGNFVEQFQTLGFDARTWELALFAYLANADFVIDRSFDSPDFLCTKGGVEIAIEATTSNPSGGVATPTTVEGLRRSAEQTNEELLERIQHEIPIRLGSSLFSKLTKRYWTLPQVGERPLVFAIESFASEDALHFSDSALASYLYGSWAEPSRTRGDLVVTTIPVAEHRGTKVIPSGFFDQPDTEHVSAVLFSNSGTITKFHRMGLQEGLDGSTVWMIRHGTCYHHDPNASVPLQFAYSVTDRVREWGFGESWGEGMALFHNPNALAPVDEELLPDASHHHLEEGQVVATVPFFHPFSSQTVVGLGTPPRDLVEVLMRDNAFPPL